MGAGGLEPPVSERTDLQSVRLPITVYRPNNSIILLIIQKQNNFFELIYSQYVYTDAVDAEFYRIILGLVYLPIPLDLECQVLLSVILKTIPIILQIGRKGLTPVSFNLISNIQHPVQSGFYKNDNLTLKSVRLPYIFIFIIRVSTSSSQIYSQMTLQYDKILTYYSEYP